MKKVLERGLYVLTDCERLSPPALLAATVEALEAGIAALQYRNKADAYGDRRSQALALRDACRRHATAFIVNDDADLAADIGADGVHLGLEDTAYAVARAKLGAAACIGISCYDDLERARNAEREGADYVAFGAFFPTTTKTARAAAGPELLRRARSALHIPIAAIGGIEPGNAGPLIESGADLLAVVRSVYGARHPADAVREFNALFAAHRPSARRAS